MVEGLSSYALSDDGNRAGLQARRELDYYIADAKAGDSKGEEGSQESRSRHHMRSAHRS